MRLRKDFRLKEDEKNYNDDVSIHWSQEARPYLNKQRNISDTYHKRRPIWFMQFAMSGGGNALAPKKGPSGKTAEEGLTFCKADIRSGAEKNTTHI